MVLLACSNGSAAGVDFFDRDLVYNPLLAPSGHGGRKTFLVIEEGYLDNQEGFWVEDEEDGAEGFLEADEDSFCPGLLLLLAP